MLPMFSSGAAFNRKKGPEGKELHSRVAACDVRREAKT